MSRGAVAVVLGSVVPGLLLLGGAVGKALDGGLGVGVAAWARLPLSALFPAGMALVCLEAALGSSLLVVPRSRRLRLTAAVVLSFFAVALVLMVFSDEPPTCHCLGAWRAFRSHRLELGLGILRNLVVVAGILWTIGPRAVSAEGGIAPA